MKKLMIASALVAFCGAVMADGIESENVVGYVGTPVAANTWQINGCQFQNTGDTEMDLQDLVTGFATKTVSYADDYLTLAPCVQVQKRDANGNLTAGNTFYYYINDAAVDEDGNVLKEGWADEAGYYVGGQVVVEGTTYTCYSAAVKIAPGTAVWFKDPQNASPNTLVAGEVVGESTAQAVKANANSWSLTANPFPVAFDLNSNKITWTGLDNTVSYTDDYIATAPCVQIQNRNAQGNLTAGNTFYYYINDAAVDEDGNVLKEGWADEAGYYVGDTVTVGGVSYKCYSSAATVGAGLGFWFKDYKSTVTITFQK